MEQLLDTCSVPDQFEQQHVRPKPGRTLIVGSRVYRGREDRRKCFPDAVGCDQLPGDGVDVVLDLEEPAKEVLGTFAHVECISVLEHSKRPWLLAENLQDLMEAGSTLHLRVPFVWREHAYPDDYWRFTRSGVRQLFPRIRWDALHYVGKKSGEKTISAEVGGYPYFARTQVLGFGVLA